jgi:phosphoglycolate phosphatase-like HAD superfamily hydrolase
MRRLAVFDIDGTLTDTNAVDDECFARAVAEVIGLNVANINWTQAPHITDSGLLSWLCTRHHGRSPEAAEIVETSRRFAELLRAEVMTRPERFAPLPGAREILQTVRSAGWHVAVATGGWHVSAALKLAHAEISMGGIPLATADDALSRGEIVQLAVARARSDVADFDDVVCIGDAIWDVETAAVLGCRFLGVGRGERVTRLKDAGAEIVLSDFSDVRRVLDALERATLPALKPFRPISDFRRNA